jgi:DNA-directed RNA polymerase subunit L
MSLKITSRDNDELHFTVDDVDASFVNAIRRIVLAECETIGFNTDEYLNSDLKMLENTSSLHNEFILHRFGLIPINISDVTNFHNSKYKFILKKENTTNDIMPVTTEDFQVFDTESNKEIPSIDFFPPNKETGEYISLLKLKSNPNKKGEKIHLEGKATRSSGNKNARYSPVSCIYYRNTQDPEKQKVGFEKYLVTKNAQGVEKKELDILHRRFMLEEGDRYFYTDEDGEPYKFQFYIESVGVIEPHLILKEAITILKKKLLQLKHNVAKITENNDSVDGIDISESIGIMKAYTINIQNETHTLGNLMQAYISKIHTDQILFIGYRNPHPLKNNIEIKLAANSHSMTAVNDIIGNTCDHIITISNQLLDTINSHFNITDKDKDKESVKIKIKIKKSKKEAI